MRILIEGARVIDPANTVDDVLDVLIEDGRIAAVGLERTARGVLAPDRVLDGRG
jgi:dihydroorotase